MKIFIMPFGAALVILLILSETIAVKTFAERGREAEGSKLEMPKTMDPRYDYRSREA